MICRLSRLCGVKSMYRRRYSNEELAAFGCFGFSMACSQAKNLEF